MKLFFTTLIALSLVSATASERPDIILIMVDDMGFSDLGYMGGEIETPHLDSLATGGVRFSQFYNSARCCPTRASLLTGLHPHETGIGWMTEPPNNNRGETQPPAYQGHINDSAVTIAERLREAGYATSMAGKWHLGYNDKEDWPLQRGFEKFYGCISGATRFFYPKHPRGMTEGNTDIETPESTTDEAFYTTDAFTDHAIRFLEEERKGEGRPHFVYLAYTAPHWPLQAFEDDIAKYRGRYKMGWDALREQRYQRQIQLGLVDEDWPLSSRTPGIPEWHTLDEKKRDEMDLKMAVYAAMIDRVDQNIGKLTASLKASDRYDDTLILFLSDNGACQEGGMFGRGEFHDIEDRNLESDNSYGEAWANAGSTPFRLYKHYLHEGGSATPFFMHWPAQIEKQDDWFREPGQLIDIVPTLLDVAGVDPDSGTLDGVTLRPAFASGELARDQPIFFEHETHASVRDGDWKLVGTEVSTLDGTDEEQWELYNIAKDRAETTNLASAKPEKVTELAAKWEAWAKRVKVYPRGDRSPPPPKPEALKGLDVPEVKERAFSIHLEIEADQPQGTAISHGGNFFGYALAFEDGRPVFHLRTKGKHTRLAAPDPVSGRATIKAQLNPEKMAILVDGIEVASVLSPGLLAEQPGLGIYVGLDHIHAVGDYEVPNRFRGKILNHRVDLEMPPVTIRSEWAENLDPESVWDAYPRPMIARPDWTNLNGYWDYAVTQSDARPETWEGKILVPFAIESPLSGVQRPFLPEDILWYQRTIPSIKSEDNRQLLHFEAVDYETTVWVNDTEIGSHTGGNLPFHFDITDALTDGENVLTVRVNDATDTAYQLHGKQKLNPKRIWYTPVSGIWQTVWMESVPATHITNVKTTPLIDGTVKIEVSHQGDFSGEVTVTASLEGKKVASSRGDVSGITLAIDDPQLWTPDSPTLYDLEITLGDDTVMSHVGLRETGLDKDDDGHWRFTLNGEPIFHWGTLDQGWWPAGLLTPPGDEAMRSDIEFLKASGFNTIRKHIKVEPRRYYYHCDRIGMLVWQDQVSALTMPRVEWTRLVPHPPREVWPVEEHKQYMAELKTMIDTLYSHPSIVQWVPFNERWGQHQTMEVADWVTSYDPTRQINIASGGNFFPGGHIVDAHQYPHPGFPFHHGEGERFDGFVKVVGEFGGHGFPVEGHLWSKNTRNWGYGGVPKDKDEWLERYRESIRILTDLKNQGIAAGIYTQTSDVEGEINGLLTYDRKVRKIEPAELKKIAAPLFE